MTPKPTNLRRLDISGTVADKPGNIIEGAKVGALFYQGAYSSPAKMTEAVRERKPLKWVFYVTKEDPRSDFKYHDGKRCFLDAEREDYMPLQKNMGGTVLILRLFPNYCGC